MVNNFRELCGWLEDWKTFTEDEFLFLQIIKRRKDNADAKFSQETIKNMHITSVDDLRKREDIIKEWCVLHNARAYLRLNKRNKRKVALLTLAKVSQNIASDNFNIKSCYESVLGEHHQDPEKTWILDVDHDAYDKTQKSQLLDAVCVLVKQAGNRDDQILCIHTKNGMHYVTPPFNIGEFHRRYPSLPLTYHKDNPVLLFVP